MEKSKVSIVIPIYNVEKYLAKCLDSVLAQTHQNLEIILVDDGSTDSSGQIADDYASRDDRIVVIHKNNEGVSATRNIGIKASTGEYVCFSDADDYLMPDYVEYLLDMIIKYDADISLTTDMFTSFRPEQTHNESVEIYSGEDATYAILCYNLPIGVYCKMFKRSFLGDSIRFIPEIFIGEGFNFNTAAFQRADKVVVGHRRVYFYRRDNPTSATTKFFLKKWENAIYAIENIHKDLIIRTPKIEKAWKYANWHTHCDAYNFMVMAGDQKRYFDKYRAWKKVLRREFWHALLLPIVPREKIRAIVVFVLPRLIPFLMSKRNERYLKRKT